ncbi:MAG: RnfABCDGE type electron transport complex subunit D, partial [Oscillospiraceae bacterium]
MARVKQQKLHPAFRPCRDYIIAMFVLVAMSTYLYGLRVPMLVATSVITAILCDLLVFGIRRRQYKFSDLSSIMFAMTFTVMMPASSSYAIIAIGTLVTVLLGKQAFGGYGCYPFNPAAFGFAFVSVCWPSEVYMYPKSFSGIGLGLTCNTALFEAPAHSLKLGGVPEIDKVDFLLGNYPGPLGTTFCIVILSCLFLLIAHKTITYHIPLTFLATCAVWAFLFPRISTGRIDSVVLEMLSGA